jgi:hypothetical protein
VPTENPIQPFSAQRNIVTLSWDPEENGRNNNSPTTGHVRSSKSWMSEGKNLSLQRLVEFERLAEQKKTARE